MGSFTDYLEGKFLDYVLNDGTFASPATVYMCLCTADPTDAATGASMNECANSNNYGRTAITFGAAASRTVTQSGDVDFPTASGSWGTVTHWAIADTDTYGAGNVLATGALSTQKSVVSGNTPSFPTTTVTVSYNAGYVSDYLANEFLDHAFGGSTYTAPATWCGLTTATIATSDDGDTVTEPSGNGYARKQVNVNGGSSPTWDLASSGVVDNTHDITFATPTGSWGTITSLGIFDASTSGNLLFLDNDNVVDQLVSVDDTVYFAAGDLDISQT